MLRYTTIVLLVLLMSCGKTPGENWQTYFEKSGGRETPSYDETMSYLRRLETASPLLHISTFGISPQGRKNPLVIIDKDAKFSAPKVRQTGKAVVMIQAGIHAGEIDGKDAMLMLLRDILIDGKYTEILDHVTILFMPFFNVDGHERSSPYNRINQNGPAEMGWRVTAQNLNLNRDYIKADAPEMRDWLRVFNEWKPDLLIDCHVTDGADYRHVVTYAIDLTRNVVEPVRRWSADIYVPYLEAKMRDAGFPMSPYVSLVDENDINQGISVTPAPPRYSTEFAAAQNRPGFLIETHMFKDYKTRVSGTYQVLLNSLQLVSREYGSLQEANRRGDELTSAMTGEFGLSFTSNGRADTIDFLGYNYRIERSDISGGPMVVWEPVPIDYRLPVYSDADITDSAEVPFAYLVPQQWTAVIDVLKAHSIRMTRLGLNKTIRVRSYRFHDTQWAKAPFEGRIMVTTNVTSQDEEREFMAGDYVIRMDQRLNRIIMHLLEPKGPDSFVTWGFFNAVFEQKEYGEAYKLEMLAREMMTADTSLKREFENRLKTDAAFAANAYGRLNWFYQRSPYWDQTVDLYPVAKIMSAEDMPR